MSSFEVLRLDEFAERLKVGRSTIFDWKNNGTLIPGRHYFQKGKVLRFIWARDLVLDLHDRPIPKEESEKEPVPEKKSDILPRKRPGPRKVGVNLDY